MTKNIELPTIYLNSLVAVAMVKKEVTSLTFDQLKQEAKNAREKLEHFDMGGNVEFSEKAFKELSEIYGNIFNVDTNNKTVSLYPHISLFWLTENIVSFIPARDLKLLGFFDINPEIER